MSVDIPNYRVLEKLGEGAQSHIYRARCMRTGKDYTVKVVKVRRPEDTGFVDLLRAEHAIGSTIDHPVIRQVYELRIMRHRLRLRGAILFMEYVDGVPMSDKSFDRPITEVLQLFREAAQGLQAMHRAGWVHADIKPNNILVTQDNKVKLIDLGQSSRMHEAKPRIQGTIDYMAPEQAQRGILDQKTDVFGLGAALHRVLTGKPVLTEMNQTVTLHSQSLVGTRITELHDRKNVKLPTCVDRLIQDCCASRPESRLGDMPAFVERLNLALAILAKQLKTADAARAVDQVPLAAEVADDTLEDTMVPDIDDSLEGRIMYDLGLTDFEGPPAPRSRQAHD